MRIKASMLCLVETNDEGKHLTCFIDMWPIVIKDASLFQGLQVLLV